ncbi:MAG: hypothetical protein OEY28_09180, partial [Nitrospira sp.]|nr:hypothetical protein [Nitrospira sp.]
MAESGSIRISGTDHGVARLSDDGQSVLFTPKNGYRGEAIIQYHRDGLNSSDHVLSRTVIVGGASLIDLRIANGPFRLDMEHAMQVITVGTLADHREVLVPPAFLQFSSSNPDLATVAPSGQVMGHSEGVGRISATAQGVQAVTSCAIGLPKARVDQMLYLLGLEVSPPGVVLEAQKGRQQLRVAPRIAFDEGMDLTRIDETLYLASNPKIVTVSPEGLVTAGQEGTASITVVHGPATTVVPVFVRQPKTAPASLDHRGGVVQTAGGATVALLPKSVSVPTAIDLALLAAETLPLPVPTPFETIAVFRLEVGQHELLQPAQVTLPSSAVAGRPGRSLVLFRLTSLPDKQGAEQPIWMQEAYGWSTPDGQFRSETGPFHGVRMSGTYVVAAADPAQTHAVQGQVSTFFPANPASTFVVLERYSTQPAIGTWANGRREFQLILGVGKESLQAREVTPQGLVSETESKDGVDGVVRGRRDRGISIQVMNQYFASNDNERPWSAPEVHAARLVKENSEPELHLEGVRFVFANERAPLDKREGSRPADVAVNFFMPGRRDPLTTHPLAGSEPSHLRVKIPAGVILGMAEVSVTRPQWQRTKSGWDRRIEMTSKREDLKVDPNYYFVPDGEKSVAVLDLSTRKLVKHIEVVGRVGNSSPRGVIIPMAYVGQEQRAYVGVQKGQRVAVIDTELLQEVDVIPETSSVDGLPFEDGEPSGMISWRTDSWNERLYVSDGKAGRIAAYDISERSGTFHQRLAWIAVGPAPNGLREMTVGEKGKRLYVIAPGLPGDKRQDRILVVDIDPVSPTYHQQIGAIPVEGAVGSIDAWGYGSGPVVFTTQLKDGPAIGAIQSDQPRSTWKISYIRYGRSLKLEPESVLIGTGVKVVPVSMPAVPYMAGVAYGEYVIVAYQARRTTSAISEERWDGDEWGSEPRALGFPV